MNVEKKARKIIRTERLRPTRLIHVKTLPLHVAFSQRKGVKPLYFHCEPETGFVYWLGTDDAATGERRVSKKEAERPQDEEAT
jgi:hypothetical protein